MDIPALMNPEEYQKLYEKQNSSEHADFRAAIMDLQHVIKGDPLTGDIGMYQMTKENYDLLKALRWLGKVGMGLAIFFAAVATTWQTFGQAIKHIFTNK